MPLKRLLRLPYMHEAANVGGLVVVRGGGVAATFLMSFLIVRRFGAETNGLFQVALSYVMISAAVARLGQEQLALREMARFKGANLPAQARETIGLSLAITFPFAILASIALAFWALWSDADDGRIAMLIAPAIAFFTWLWIFTEALRGWQKVTVAIFWQASFVPIAFVLSFLALDAFGALSIDLLPLMYAGCAFVAMLGAAWNWNGAMRQDQAHTGPRYASSKLFPAMGMARDGVAFWLLAILTNLAGWIDFLVLYAVADATVVGIFQPIIRTGGLIAVAINIVTAGLVANLALFYASGQLDNFIRAARMATLAIVVGSAIAALTFVLFASDIMALWGPEFAPYHAEFSLYVLIQLFQSVFIVAPLAAPVMGLERGMVMVQIVNLPLKLAAVWVGYSVGGLAGVIAGLGLCVVISVGWITLLFFRQLAVKGLRWQTVISGQL